MSNDTLTKQFNCQLPVTDLEAVRRLCYVNGVTLSGMVRHIFNQAVAGSITLDFDTIRRADYEHRAKGSRF